MEIVYYLTPFIPLSFQQERGRRRKRGASPPS
jgi:hypothetical protein